MASWTDFTRMQVPVGFLAAGEPLGHHFHHRFPTSPGLRPGRFDPGCPGALAGVDA